MDKINSLLFVPAEEKKLSKIGKINADAYIIDLEDSIDKENKEIALLRTIKFLDDNKEDNIFVRINKDRYMYELEQLKKYSVGIVLPKFDEVDDYMDAKLWLDKHCVIAMIESPKSLMNANTIASIPWVDALAFGAEDFSTTSNILNTYENLFVYKSLLVLAAKANDKKVYDTPCFKLNDEVILDKEVRQAVNLGYDGKLSIHPKHIKMINELFRIKDRDYLEKIVNIFEKNGETVSEINGRVYEQLHINHIKEQIKDMEL